MTMRTSLRTRVSFLLLIAGATVVVASTTAPAVEAALPTPGSNNASSGADSIEKILAETPIAGCLPAGSTMAKIKESGRAAGRRHRDRGPVLLRDPDHREAVRLRRDVVTDAGEVHRRRAEDRAGSGDVADPRTAAAEQHRRRGVRDRTITPARAEKISFAGPYYMSGISIMVKKTDSSIKSMADLAGKTVATQSNSTAATTLTKTIPTATPLLLATNDECLQAVRQGRAQAYIIDQAILIGNAVRNNDVKVVGAPFTQEPYGAGTAAG